MSDNIAYNIIIKNHPPGIRPDGLFGDVSGFFSNFNKLIEHLSLYKPIYSITFSVFYLQDTYGSGEVFSKVFIPYTNPEFKDYKIIDIHADDYIEGKITGIYAQYFYTKDGCEEKSLNLDWRNQYNVLYKKHIILNKGIQTIFNNFKDKINMLNKKYKITFLIRHDTHKVEQPNNRMPTFDQYDKAINEACNGDLENSVLICLTDSEDAYKYFSDKYKNYTIIMPEVERSTNNEIQKFWSSDGDCKKAYMALLSVLYLSIGDYFIHMTSNMSTAVLYINPEIKSIFLVG